MSSDFIIRGFVDNNSNLVFYHKELFEAQKRKILQKDKEFEMILRPKEDEVSESQHGYYRAGICRWLVKNTEEFGGWLEEEVHQFFADMFLGVTRIFLHKEEHHEKRIVLSTGSLNKEEMSEFVMRVLAWLAGHGITPPDPETINIKKYRKVHKLPHSKLKRS